MKKKYAIFALAALTMAACNNEEESTLGNGNVQTLADLDPVIVYTVGNTREAMNMDLINTWVNGDALGLFSQWDKNRTGDVNQYVNNGTQNARFQFYNTFTLNGTTYTDRWAQDGLLSGTPLTAATAVTWNASNLHFDTKYNFYVYYPYTAGATQTAVPFTLSSQQTQTTPDEWTNNGSNCYNFMYSSSIGTMRPADRKLPFDLVRLLPVAEFNIVRDGDRLDGYYLQSIKLETPSGVNGGLKTGNLSVDLSAANAYSSLPFTSTTNVKDYTVLTTSNNADYTTGMLMSSAIGKNKSLIVYMSVNPCTLTNSTVTATFYNGVNYATLSIDRTGDKFVVEKGKGNIERYYLHVENASIQSGNVIGSTEDTTISK